LSSLKTSTVTEGELYGLIGHPVAHSLSPYIFKAAFAAAGVEAVYELFPILPEKLDSGVKELLDRGVRGFNVTVPHKTSVIPMMKKLDESAILTGAVNTVEVTADGMVGHNTDMGGFRDSLVPLGVPDISDARVLVVGAGGAARAVVTGLALSGAAKITIANRFIEETTGLLSAVAPRFPELEFEAIGFNEEEVAHGASDVVLCVHATSLGLSSDDPLPLDPAVLPTGSFLYDLVYSPDETALVKAARAAGYQAADGKEMLLRQAVAGYRILTGKEPPVDAMRAGMEEGIGKK
jgi:shikimate dehydrogenase